MLCSEPESLAYSAAWQFASAGVVEKTAPTENQTHHEDQRASRHGLTVRELDGRKCLTSTVAVHSSDAIQGSGNEELKVFLLSLCYYSVNWTE